jgi:GT2 family glycosyltransferase
LEIVLVDNGSTDGSLEWVTHHYPDVRLLPLATNCGFCGGNNAGINSARGDYVVLLNNDTEVAPDWLEQLYTPICADERIAACDSKVLYFDRRDMIWSSGGTYSIAGTTTFRLHMQTDGPEFQQPADVFVAGACSAIYRKSILMEIGLLDEDFFAGYEDVDWSFRARLRGFRIVNVPASKVYHKVSATHQYNSNSYVRNGQRNVTAVFVKNMPSGLLLKYWPLHLIYVLGSAAYFTKIGRGNAFLKAKLKLSAMKRLIIS